MSYSSEVLADSPLMYFRMGESSGTTMTDSSGNGRNGTYVNSPTLGSTGLLTGDSDTAVTFTGAAGQEATVPDDNSLDGLSAFTVEVWLNGSATFSGTNYIVSRDDGSANRSFMFRAVSNKLQFVKIPNGTVTTSGATTLVVGNIYHFAAVYNGTDIRLYVNGVLDNTPAAATGSLGTINRILEIGMRLAAGPMVGVFDEIAIYGTALSSTRIAAHYTAGTTAPGTAASGAGSLSLSASGAGAGSGAGSAALALSASGDTAAAASSSASLSLSASGTVDSSVASGTASLSLSAAGDIAAPADGGASLSLSASGTVTEASSSGAAVLVLSALGQVPTPAAGTGYIEIRGDGVAIALIGTDSSNLFDGRWRSGRAAVTITRPVAALPPGKTYGDRVDKVLVYPAPTMVDGRPT